MEHFKFRDWKNYDRVRLDIFSPYPWPVVRQTFYLYRGALAALLDLSVQHLLLFVTFWGWVCLFCFVGVFFCLFVFVWSCSWYLVSSSFFTVLLQNFHCGRDILVYSNIVCSLSLYDTVRSLSWYCVCSWGWQLMTQNRKMLLLDVLRAGRRAQFPLTFIFHPVTSVTDLCC